MSISSRLVAEIATPSMELEAKLAEVEATLSLVSAAIQIRPRLSRMLRWDGLGNYERQLTNQFVGVRDVSTRMVLTGLMVVCYGSLERFLKELVERAVSVLNEECAKLDELPAGIRQENVFRTGQALQTVKDPGNWAEYDYMGLAKSLGSCEDGSIDYSLNARCFTFAQKVMSPTNIDLLLERIGVRLNWDCFGRDDDIKRTFGQTRTRDCSKAVRESVGFLVRVRNVASHTGDLDVELEKQHIDMYVKLLPPFCAILVAEVGKQLEKRCARMTDI